MMPWKGFVAKIEEFRLQRLESARQIDRCSVRFAETLMNKKGERITQSFKPGLFGFEGCQSRDPNPCLLERCFWGDFDCLCLCSRVKSHWSS